MAVQQVALIFDDQVRPDTTGVYCRRALQQLVKVRHFKPSEIAEIPRQGFDLYLNIDDGLEYSLAADLRPCAWWAIDTHLNFDWRRNRARDFDFVFAAQRDGAERMQEAGVAAASWLPLACDPEVHRKHETAKAFDFCFVGHVFPGPRADLLRLLAQRFGKHFIGQRFFDQMAQTYSASRAVFNRSLLNDVNMRVFEALACGSLLVTNDLGKNGQDDLFRDGVHLATYASADELVDKIAFYLAHEDVRERIAAAGRAEVLGRDTYRHRMEFLLAEVERGLARTTIRASADAADRRIPSRPDDVTAATAPNRKPEPDAVRKTNVAEADSLVEEYAAPSRAELLALVPPSARKILAVGYGVGALRTVTTIPANAEIICIETGEKPTQAGRHPNDLVTTDLEKADMSFTPQSFDAVVCDGLFERLRDPLPTLRRLRQWLTPEGHLIARIPNVRYHPMVRNLLAGHWNCEPPGCPDGAPIQFYTRREIEKVFQRADFHIDHVEAIPGLGYAEWHEQGRPSEVRAGSLHTRGLNSAEAEEFYASGYLIHAKPAEPADYGLTSIVILTHNQLAYTRLCLESIRRYTDEPYELIVVDNASTDATREYVGSVDGAKLIGNDQNRGFPVAANQGIAAASGRNILLLNNDTVVTTGWLRRLLQALHRDPKIGLVGPCSNRVSGEQEVAVGYDDLAGLDGFAWDWGKANEGKARDADRLVGFCLLMRRELVEKIGCLDERFGVGCFEDDDFCRRALQAGFRAVIAEDAFVHHFGGRTFIGAGVDFPALMRENERLFSDKWMNIAQSNQDVTVLQPPTSAQPTKAYTLRVADGGGLLLQRQTITISLCMIVRDNAATIEACLQSIKPWVDEMVVVDTGSKDDTPQIVKRMGARLFHFEWCDDFSAARNESLRHARGRWIFWMDSDDMIDADCGRQLKELPTRIKDPAILGCVMQVHCPGPGDNGQTDVTVVDHVKLFRNLPELSFDGRIHEQILPAIRRAGGETAWTNVFVVHSGYDHSPEGQERKKQRDLRLLHQELRERPEHPFTLFNLGMTYADVGEYEHAAGFLVRSLRRSGEGESHLRKVYALLTYCHAQLRQTDQAWNACAKGLQLFPEDLELRFRQALLLHEAGRLDESAVAYISILNGDGERYFTSVDRGIRGFKARQNLALVYADMGDLIRSEEQWRLVVQEAPRYRAGWRGLGESLLRRGKREEARSLTDQMLAAEHLRGDGLVLRGWVATADGDIAEAKRRFHEAAMVRPNDPEALEARCRFLFENGEPTETEAALRDLLRLRPQDAAAHHNLGTVYVRQGRMAAAAEAYSRSLQLRPDSASTWVRLGDALREVGRNGDAAEAWRQAARLDPGNVEVVQALRRVRQGVAP